MRGVEIQRLEIDSPWLFEGDTFLRVNGVDVLPLVDAELNRRFPGRAQRFAVDPDGLRDAWAALERTWSMTLERVAGMPTETVDISIGGEWSFAQTLRHLVLATDTWLGRAILGTPQPYHPLGLVDVGTVENDELDLSVFSKDQPSYAEVLDARAGRVAMVRDYLRPRHTGRASSDAQEPLGARVSGDDSVLSAHDPRRGVGAPPLRGTRPR